MAQVKRTLCIVTEQKINPNKPSPQEGYSMRDWSIEFFIVHEETGALMPATIYEKAVYMLHPTFGKKAKQTKTTPPFRVEEEGWGEFGLKIHCTSVGKAETHDIDHDLNFQQERYENRQVVSFKSPKPDLLALLKQTGSVPDSLATPAAKADAGKRKRTSKNVSGVDMERLADSLQKLSEDDLLHIVQLIHDHKSTETYVKNDVENGEFHVDLYTLPDQLVKMLWDFSESKGML